MPTILVLDLGTTYFKAVLFDQGGEIVALERIAAPIIHPQPGRWEIDPLVFTRTIEGLVASIGTQRAAGLVDLAAISFSTQTNSFMLLGGDDRPLTPLILWPDDRARELEGELQSLAPPAEMATTTGLPQLTFQMVPARLLWLRRHQPHILEQSRRLCLISDYLTLWLSGQHATEAGAMAFTGLVDIRDLNRRSVILERFEVPHHWLPRIVRAGTDLGPILASVAERLGISHSCRIIAGAFDQHAGAIGVGNIAPGGASETTGTVLVSVRCAARFNPITDRAVYQGPAFAPGLYYQLAVSETSANLLEWYRNQLPGRPDFAALDRLAADVPADAAGLKLRPNPHPGRLSDMFLNLAPHHTSGQAVRCIMEAVATELKSQVELLWGDKKPAIIAAAGGASCSALWLQIKANRLGIPFAASACPEPTSLGAAMLAGQSLGWGSLAGLSAHWVRLRRVHKASVDSLS